VYNTYPSLLSHIKEYATHKNVLLNEILMPQQSLLFSCLINPEVIQKSD